MGEEVRPDDVVAEWEDGLPTADDLTPLCQSLIPPELASAFKISPEPPRTAVDVHRASQTTLSSLRSNPFTDPDDMDEPDPDPDPKKARRADEAKNFTAEEDQSTAKNSKKPRLVWTPELHKRFIEVVAYLGLKNAVPKTIMQMMNVEGLTRENVASHLQKYRLYMRRQGYSDDGPLPSDHRLFTSAQQSVAESSNANNNNNNTNNNSNSNSGGMGNGNSGNNHHNHSHGHMGMPIPMPYHHPQMMQMPIMPSNGHGFHTYHQHHNQQQYSGMVQQQSDWSGNSSKYNKHSNHTFQNNQ